MCSAVLAFALPAWAAPGDLKLTIGEGRVTLIADSVPVRTILQEWERLGQSKIVNAEKVTGGPVTLRLVNVPEADALDVVLRSASGYLAAPRPVQIANASQFDRIVILATSRPTTSASAPMPQPQMQPQFPSNPAVAAPIVEDEDEPEEQTPPNAPAQMPVTAPRPGFVGSPNAPAGMQPPMQGQQPQTQQPQQQVPVTAPRPGVIQPQQQPPTQPPPPPRPIPQ
jgi:hypothetical protein